MPIIEELRGKTPKIAKSVHLSPDVVIIGDVEIGEGSSIWYKTVIRGDVNSIRIGRETNIQDGSVIHATYEYAATKIGDRVSIGHNVILHGCEIGDSSLVGMGSIVMDKAKIPKNSLVGAGSLVTEDSEFPEGHLIIGRPARAIRLLKPEELKRLEQSADNYKLYTTWYV